MTYRHYFVGLLALVSLGSLYGQEPQVSNLLPNGSLEYWSQFAPEVLPRLKSEGVFDSRDPLVPTQWNCEMAPGTLQKRSKDCHGGKYALSIGAGKGGSGRLSLGRLEVIPGAEYSFGVWIKGNGEVNAVLCGQAIEGTQTLGAVKAQASDQYRLLEGKATIPRHIRFVTLSLGVSAKAEVLLDDAHISAELGAPYDADAVLAKKYERDDHTVVFADFEKDDPGIILETKAHIIKEGKFGRALRIDPPDIASIPLKVARMPAEGTLEFWLSPDEVPCLQKDRKDAIKMYLSVRSAAMYLAYINSDTSANLRCSWRNDDQPYGKKNSVTANCLGTLRKGQWTHIAITWDQEAWRMYVNGVLSGVQAEGDLKWFAAPGNIGISSDAVGMMWKGAIDEIRVSDVKRYGPLVPKGAKAPPLVKNTPPPPTPAVAEPSKPKVDTAAQREKLIEALPPSVPVAAESTPNAAGDYVYEACSLRPMVTDSPLNLAKDVPAPGLTVATIGQGFRYSGWINTGGAYWTLRDIKPGRYWLGLWYQSNSSRSPGLESPVGINGPLTVYLNGRIVQNATVSDPVQVAKGVWYAEIQSADAEPLKAGDEIVVLPKRGDTANLLRLVLHSTQPRRGAGRYPLNFEGHFWHNYNALTLTAETYFLGKKNDRLRQGDKCQFADGPEDLGRDEQGRGLAVCLLANPLPVAVTVDYECVVKGYFLQALGKDSGRITLQPHQRITRRIAFDVPPSDTSYSIRATLRAVGPPDPQKVLGWPKADTIPFFPGLRQQLPWPEAFNYRDGQLLVFLKPLPGLRQATSLDGVWQAAFTPSLSPAMPTPQGLAFGDRHVPFRTYQCPVDKIEPRPHGMYLRRTFELPAEAAERTYRIVVERLNAEGTLFVNGKNLGTVRGGNTPLVADITSAAKPGKNELMVVLRDVLAIMDQAYVNPASPTASVLYLDAPGGDGFELGKVTLEASPAVAADETLVRTSYRDRVIRVRTAVTSHLGQAGKFVVKATVLDAKEPRLELGQKEVTLEPGKPQTLSFEKVWKDAQLWSPSSPYLYVLAVEIAEVATGKVIDRAYERFGFRETWIEGPNVMFNGIPIKVKGFTCGQAYTYVGDALLSRGSHGVADYMDEFGYFCTEYLAAIFNSSSKHNVERDVFWEVAARNILASAKRKQNHPSIIAWDLSNEWLGFLGYGGGDPLLGAKRFKKLSDTLKEQDPTRWTFFNGDGNLEGMHDTFSTHYMYPQARKENLDTYMPDYAFWRPLEKEFEAGKDVMVCPNQNWAFKYGREMLMDSECLWKVGRQQPPGFTQFAGEEDVLSPAIDSGSGPVAWLWKQLLDGHRDLGVFTVSYYATIPSTVARGWVLQTFILPDTAHHGFAEQTLSRKLSLHNDVFRKARFTLDWRLVLPSGEVCDKGQIARDMATADLQRADLTFRLPKVAARTRCTLDLQLAADGKFVYGEERDIDVWPAAQPAAAPPPREVVLFDPSGKTAQRLTSEGVRFAKLESIAPWSRANANGLLVIGEDALTLGNAADLAKMERFVEGGGNVLVLAQKVTPEGLPAKTALEPREWASQVFVRVDDHPILQGLTSWDLHFWSPDRVCSYGAYSKPEGGPALVLLDSGAAIGLEWTQMLEMYRGKGMYLLCQLPLVSKHDTDPMARELLARTLAYAAGTDMYHRPVGRMKAVVKTDSTLERRLRDMGVSYEVVAAGAPVAGGDVLFVDAATVASPPETPQCQAWSRAMADGATVVVAGASPADAAWLTALAGKTVQVTVPRYRMWEGRGYRDGIAKVTAGLSQCDLYYKNYGGAEGDCAQAEDPTFMLEPLQDYSVRIEGARELVFPGALVEAAVGNGRLLIDQRRWHTQHERLVKLANRQVSALAMGLGVSVAPVAKPRELPQGVAYRTLDLRLLANRALIDDVPDDGKGGFTDQGPDADLHDFPTGRRTFHGVPFDVGQKPNSCIVLASNKRPGVKEMPLDVTIPIGFAAQGLVFLHTMAYSSDGLVGAYQVKYADGQTADILLYGGENIRDWVANPGPFAREKGTTSAVAWTSSCKMWPVIAVYQMLWVNPRPQIAIKSVRFHNPKKESVPVLIGLTAAVDAGQDQEAAQNRAQAKDLLAQALKAISGRDDAKARPLLKQAILKDSTLWDAHRALADLCEKGGDDNATLQAYRDWADAGATSPLPYNRIGQILEKRKDYRGALDAYTRSLKVEWNQPPIIEAKSRLEKLKNQ